MKATKLQVHPYAKPKHDLITTKWKTWCTIVATIGEVRHRTEGPATIFQNGRQVWERWDQ